MFLQPTKQVIATLNQDYPEWHKGREQFSLWYLEILDTELIEYLQLLRDAFDDILFQPNTRQFHITVYICGFKTDTHKQWDDDFDHYALLRQISAIQQLNLHRIQLKTRRINSFESALFVEVEDTGGTLNHIRQTLAQISDEVAPLDYCPHITLGLYKTQVSGAEVMRRFNTISQRYFELNHSHLSFGSYQSHILQGELTPEIQVQVGSL